MIKFAFNLAQLLYNPRKLILTWILFYPPCIQYFFKLVKGKQYWQRKCDLVHTRAFEKVSFDKIHVSKTRKLPEWLGVYLCSVISVMLDSLQPYGLWPARLLSPWDSPGKNTGVGCHALLQGIFLTQGLNPGLLHYRRILYSWATGEVWG